MANKDLRYMARDYGVRFWEIAHELNVSEATVTRMFRFELPDDKKEKIRSAILAIYERKLRETVELAGANGIGGKR